MPGVVDRPPPMPAEGRTFQDSFSIARPTLTCEYAEREEQMQQIGGKVAEYHAQRAKDAAHKDDSATGETLTERTRERREDQTEGRQYGRYPGGNCGR